MSYKRGSTRIGKKTLSNFEKLISTYQYICRPRIKLHPRFSKHENKHLEQENSEFIFWHFYYAASLTLIGNETETQVRQHISEKQVKSSARKYIANDLTGKAERSRAGSSDPDGRHYLTSQWWRSWLSDQWTRACRLLLTFCTVGTRTRLRAPEDCLGCAGKQQRRVWSETSQNLNAEQSFPASCSEWIRLANYCLDKR